MDDLPKERVTGCYLYSFAISDVNYMGLLLIKESRHREQVGTK